MARYKRRGRHCRRVPQCKVMSCLIQHKKRGRVERRIKGKYNLKELYAIILLSNITILHARSVWRLRLILLINERWFHRANWVDIFAGRKNMDEMTDIFKNHLDRWDFFQVSTFTTFIVSFMIASHVFTILMISTSLVPIFSIITF